MVKTLAAAITMMMVLGACGSAEPPPGDSADETSTTADRAPPDRPTTEIMAAALFHLVTVNNTFGEGPPPFTEYLIQTHTDPQAGTLVGGGGAIRALTAAERTAIEERIALVGPVRWIDDPDEWRTPERGPKVEGSVILGVGEAAVDGDTALMPVSLWCGYVCGTWLTYRLDIVDGVWEVGDIEGPMIIS